MADKKETVKSLRQKMVEVLADLGPVEKKSRNAHFGYNYVSEGQMMAELRDRLSSRNIFLLTSVEECQPTFGDGKSGVFVTVRTKHTFIDSESGEELTVFSAGVGWDSGDKGVYKAITGATKYALMKNFLVTDEQNDPEAGGGGGAAPKGKHSRTKAYEDEKDAGAKATSDLLELSKFLIDNEIPEGFVVALLKEKKLVSPQLQLLGNAPPGVIRRTLTSREKLLKAFRNSSAAPQGQAEGKPQQKVERGPFDDLPPEKPTPKLRQPIAGGNPTEIIAQDGHEDWREVAIHFGKQKGSKLGKIGAKSLMWWIEKWIPEKFKGSWQPDALRLDAALCLAHQEIAAAATADRNGGNYA